MPDFREFGSFSLQIGAGESGPESGPSGVIVLVKNARFSFLSGAAVILHLLVILAADAAVKSPGEIFIADFCHYFTALDPRVARRARCVPDVS